MSDLRISIVGCSGSGKTTLSRQVERLLGLPRLELDGVYHQPGWQPLDDEAFRSRVTSFMDTHEGWIIDGNYSPVQEYVWERATTVVWLHPTRWRAMLRVGWRSLRRAVSRTDLWNGNREPWSTFYSLDPERSILAWTWTRYPDITERYTRLQVDSRWAGIDHYKFVNRTQLEGWLAELARSAPPDSAD